MSAQEWRVGDRVKEHYASGWVLRYGVVVRVTKQRVRVKWIGYFDRGHRWIYDTPSESSMAAHSLDLDVPEAP